MTAKLEARGIRLDYVQPRTNTRLTALDGVDLEVMDGEFDPRAAARPRSCRSSTA